MISYEDARKTILSYTRQLEAESVALLDSLGRVLACDIRAPWNLPRFSNSAMDGYAVRAAECSVGRALPLSGYIAAGQALIPVLPHSTAIKIMTGAPIPDGCDSIIPLEHATEYDGMVRPEVAVMPNQHVRHAGDDIREGEVVLQKGTVLRAAEINVLATFNVAHIPVIRCARVAILATGDELVELGHVIESGKVVNSNSYSLAAAVKSAGGDPLILGIARDDLKSHIDKLQEGLRADVLITSAGVSVGDRDFVREALVELGLREIFWKVDMRPGKALAFGVKGKTLVFSLPGNPVATMLTFEEFVAPVILAAAGHCHVLPHTFSAKLDHSMNKKAGSTQLSRMHVHRSNGQLIARSAGSQNTSSVRTLLAANAIAVLPADREAFSAGEQVRVHLLAGSESFD